MVLSKRTALLAAGVSAIAIAAGGPAFSAAVHTGGSHHVSQAPFVNQLITIDIGTTTAGGADDTPVTLNPTANAVVDGGTALTAAGGTAIGGYVQFGSATDPNGNATIALHVAGNNSGVGTLRVTAIASATSSANATIVTGINQSAVAPKAVAPAPIAVSGMPKTLPNGFDISRFGRHTQAAYLGRTPDNPSYSLKRRLKRASFFDQREREAAGAMREPVYPESRAPQVATADQVTVRMAPGRKPSNFGYVSQR